ncbi:MAG: cold-shock protein [Planctomycetes bacterium]|nr:cold-shock protein [Planctomycetota bacterium]
MAEGTVKWFDKKKGYGFIAHTEGDDVFVHYTGFASSDLRTLNEGQTVCFEIVEGEKGLRADQVSLKADAQQSVEDTPDPTEGDLEPDAVDSEA